MNIVVTGATGTVGRNLVEYLGNTPNVNILTINRDITKACYLFKQPNVTNIGLNELDKIESFDPNYIIHLATLYTSRNDSEILCPLIESNILFGLRLLDALKHCKNIDVFLNFGTFAEFGNTTKFIDNLYLYSATKTAFRVFLDYYSSLYKIKYVHIVPYTIYGGNDSIKKIIDYIYDSLDSPEPIKTTLGYQKLDLIHLNDIIMFIHTLLCENKISLSENRETIYLGTGIGTNLRQIALEFEKLTNKKCNLDWGALPYRERDIMQAIAPKGSLQKYNYTPRITVKEGLTMYLNSKSWNKTQQ